MDSRTLIRLLQRHGFVGTPGKGSHWNFRKPGFPRTITVPHPRKDLGVGLIQRILRDAQIDEDG